MVVVQNVAPCSLVDTDRCYGDAYFLHHHGYEWPLMIETLRVSETSVIICEATLHNIPENSHLHTLLREYLNLAYRKATSHKQSLFLCCFAHHRAAASENRNFLVTTQVLWCRTVGVWSVSGNIWGKPLFRGHSHPHVCVAASSSPLWL
jgi:hypothetical protein